MFRVRRSSWGRVYVAERRRPLEYESWFWADVPSMDLSRQVEVVGLYRVESGGVWSWSLSGKMDVGRSVGVNVDVERLAVLQGGEVGNVDAFASADMVYLFRGIGLGNFSLSGVVSGERDGVGVQGVNYSFTAREGYFVGPLSVGGVRRLGFSGRPLGLVEVGGRMVVFVRQAAVANPVTRHVVRAYEVESGVLLGEVGESFLGNYDGSFFDVGVGGRVLVASNYVAGQTGLVVGRVREDLGVDFDVLYRGNLVVRGMAGYRDGVLVFLSDDRVLWVRERGVEELYINVSGGLAYGVTGGGLIWVHVREGRLDILDGMRVLGVYEIPGNLLQVRGVVYGGERELVVVYRSGLVYRTVDGGLSWRLLYEVGGGRQVVRFWSVGDMVLYMMVDDSAVGGDLYYQFYVSFDMGRTWRRLSGPGWHSMLCPLVGGGALIVASHGDRCPVRLVSDANWREVGVS